MHIIFMSASVFKTPITSVTLALGLPSILFLYLAVPGTSEASVVLYRRPSNTIAWLEPHHCLVTVLRSNLQIGQLGETGSGFQASRSITSAARRTLVRQTCGCEDKLLHFPCILESAPIAALFSSKDNTSCENTSCTWSDGEYIPQSRKKNDLECSETGVYTFPFFSFGRKVKANGSCMNRVQSFLLFITSITAFPRSFLCLIVTEKIILPSFIFCVSTCSSTS